MVDIEKAISVFPILDIKLHLEVSGEKEIAVGDILTIKITITQSNLKEGEQAGFVHSNMYPFLKNSSWYLVFTDQEQNNFFAMEKIFMKDRVFVKEIKERMMNPGKNMLFITLKNDSYKGFDKFVRVEFFVLKEVQRAAVEYNDEDIQAAKAPSMMQSMMEMEGGNPSDDELESDEEPHTHNTHAPHMHHHPHAGPCNHDHGPQMTPTAQPAESKKD